MVKIRLTRIGKKNDPFYRVIAIDESKKRSGAALANFGYWHPKKDLKKIDEKEIKAWVAKGAQMTLAVEKLLK